MINFDGLSAPLPQALASALRRLAQLAHTMSWDQWAAQRLTPTQRRILEFLGSRHENITLSAGARELGVTPATASDSVAALEAKGLVRKRRSHTDVRALALMLTTDGRRSVTELASLPDPLQAAFGGLTDDEQSVFYRSAMKMIRELQETGALPPSRMCVRCRYFDPFRYQQSSTPHHCHLIGAPLADRHLRMDCPEHELADEKTQAALWTRFSGVAPSPADAANVDSAGSLGGSAETLGGATAPRVATSSEAREVEPQSA
jgi:DNA-binding MarR family transcriptional regulator